MELNLPQPKKVEVIQPQVMEAPVMELDEAPVAQPVKNIFKAPSLASMGMSNQASNIIAQATISDPKTKKTQTEEQQEVYEELNMRDEEQIYNSLTGKSMGEFVYEYCPKHKWEDGKRGPDCTCKDTVMDLSWEGIQEASRSMGITIMPHTSVVAVDEKGTVQPIFGAQYDDPGILAIEYPKYREVWVRAKDPFTGIVRVGIARQGKEIFFRNGGSKEDEFYPQKALSKAERNTLRQLIPQVVIRTWIKQFLDAKKPGAGNQQKAVAVTEPTLQKLLAACADKKIEVTLQDLRLVVLHEGTAAYCLQQLETGNVKGFTDWLAKGLEKTKAAKAPTDAE